ncbi:hypothetical protein P8821_22925, partial [Bacillus licheniformis]|nr:hypothetical protein [Bacillus licheniformis]
LAYLESLLKPYASKEMEAYEVAPLVNSPHHNSPELIKKAPKKRLSACRQSHKKVA